VVSFESSGVLWQVLRVVERTILARTITFRTARGRLDLDVRHQCVMLCPRLEGAFVVDEQFRREAPDAYEAVRQGGVSLSGQLSRTVAGEGADAGLNAALASLSPEREALLRLWGRALAELCAGVSEVETTVEAAAPSSLHEAEEFRRLGFNAMELLRAVSVHLSLSGDSQVLAFYTTQRQTAPDAWLFHLAGWPAAFPGEVIDLGRLNEMGQAAATARTWRNNLADVPGPIMSVLMGARQDAFLCVAVDDAYVALISRPSAELGSALAAWRLAQQGQSAGPSSLLQMRSAQSSV
jgi:hypothetical protein